MQPDKLRLQRLLILLNEVETSVLDADQEEKDKIMEGDGMGQTAESWSWETN